ncbi:hypothetical protein AcV7_005076 [Taiwanofungus camphoratus]|nr:hypothetical protein AcV7_005076 [Antrodia cinnamomea]
MGQYWDIINLDKKETRGPGSKLGEFMFDRSPETLVNVFAVPLCPPDPPNTPAKNQRESFTPPRGMKPALGVLDLPPELLGMIFVQIHVLRDVASFCVTNTVLYAIGRRRVHELMVAKTWVGDRVVCLGDYSRTPDLPRGMLTDAEMEALRVKEGEVLSREERWNLDESDDDNIDGDEDIDGDGNGDGDDIHGDIIINLDYFKDADEDQAQDVDKGEEPRAEGKESTETSEPTKRVDHDTDEKTDEDAEERPGTSQDAEDAAGTEAPVRPNRRPRNLYRSLWHHATSEYKEVGYSTRLPYEFMYRMRSAERKAFEQLITPNYGPKDLSWALLNRTKREYVRADAVAELTNAPRNGPFIEGRVGLGEVLLSRICWSSDDETGTPFIEGLHRGKWAGDRFEINTMERLDELRARETWTDMTKEVLDEVVTIWDCVFDDDSWRKT